MQNPRWAAARYDPAKPRLVAGTLAVALLIGGTRWASHLGVNPIYLADVLLLAAAWNIFWGVKLFPGRYPLAESKPPYPLGAMLVFAWATIRLFVGMRLDVTALRDAVPYLYAVLALLAWYAIRRSTPEGRERTRKLLMAALWFHAGWTALLVIAPSLPQALPTINAAQALHVFSPRPDVDAPLNALLAAILTLRLLRGQARRKFLTTLAIVGCWTAIFVLESRAGLLGAVVVSVFALVVFMVGRDTTTTRKQLFVAALPAFLAIIAVTLPMTTTGDRLLATFGASTSASSLEERGAAGTTRARSNAWERLTQWTLADDRRMLVGEGFGPNVLADSGAARLLVNTKEEGEAIPRSPHNYWAGTFARLGLVGVLLTVAAGLGLLRRIWKQRRQAADDPFLFLCMAIPLGFLVPATLGVVFESPFGAVPFWWCIGAVAALSVRTGAEDTVPVRPVGLTA